MAIRIQFSVVFSSTKRQYLERGLRSTLYTFHSSKNIVSIITIESKWHKNASVDSNLNCSCSFKLFTAEKKYTKSTFPGFISLLFFVLLYRFKVVRCYTS